MSGHRPSHEVELYKESDRYELYVDLPDYDRDDVDVSWRDGRLHVTAEGVDPDTGRTRVFHRDFSFPYEVVAEEISGTYADDVLEVSVPFEEGAASDEHSISLGDGT